VTVRARSKRAKRHSPLSLTRKETESAHDEEEEDEEEEKWEDTIRVDRRR
jgi:hypothetical protein